MVRIARLPKSKPSRRDDDNKSSLHWFNVLLEPIRLIMLPAAEPYGMIQWASLRGLKRGGRNSYKSAKVYYSRRV
ncbi:MAG: hypothetical protein HUU12_02290 [Anaerolineales bacterium]|nr:hypothetical protein [Anaerolineales bacterium]NUQ58196.1 hypothetical protein [Anaerolineales bacterium]